MRESKRVQLNAFTAGSSSCLVSSGGVMGTVIFFVQVATPIYRPAKPVELLGARWCKKGDPHPPAATHGDFAVSEKHAKYPISIPHYKS